MTLYVAAIDQGTTSTRCMIFDRKGCVVAGDRLEHAQRFPRPGWVEHDAAEIWENTRRVVEGALANGGLTRASLAAVGITNQRETTVVWDRAIGVPIHPAIVWQDTRTQAICDELAALGTGASRYRERVGLPLSTYFSAPKIRWILDHVDGARIRAERGEILFGTMDTWLLWNLTGGVDGGVHVTDVTNASRTLLMDLKTLRWDLDIAAEIGVPAAMLPEIRSSSEIYGRGVEGPIAGVPIAGLLGDQQAAAFGQVCFSPGAAKNTYGTGNFMLLTTGREPVSSRHGLLTTVAYRIGGRGPRSMLSRAPSPSQGR
jgi:glycerol kinase